jgi:hypothetical protein
MHRSKLDGSTNVHKIICYHWQVTWARRLSSEWGLLDGEPPEKCSDSAMLHG